jgi:hypothetical protein
MVCRGGLEHYFTKDFGGQWGLNEVEYLKCAGCGLTMAKTVHDMTGKQWETLNVRFHRHLFASTHDDHYEDPLRAMRLRGLRRMHRQAETIAHLAVKGLLPRNRQWIDYGCGDGTLANMLSELGLPTLKFDRYMARKGEGYLVEDDVKGPYGLVINTAMFEHIRDIEGLDRIAGLVSDRGVLALHVMVRESIPEDPEWPYLLPVHCTLFTNRSMQRLFDRWGFRASLYHVPGRMWFWFMQEANSVERLIDENGIGEAEGFYYKRGFADYWK